MNEVPRDWPYRDRSALIRCPPHEWHVQVFGDGPDILCLHGAGASGHSFHALVPHLPGFRMILVDLPGQGFTRPGATQRLGLDAMADDLAALCDQQGFRPQTVIGHSAGAAVALRMAEILPAPPRAVVGINAALGTFDGFEGWLFPKLARAMHASPFIAQIVTKFSSKRKQVERLLAATGSTLSAEGVTLYQRLVARTAHIEGTLGMMAQWKLEPLLERLPQMEVPTLLIGSEKDRAVPCSVSRVAAARMPRATYAEIPALGHLVHEEAPLQVAELILPFIADQRGILSVVPRSKRQLR
jgi:magnesium chelatase accessory protein